MSETPGGGEGSAIPPEPQQSSVQQPYASYPAAPGRPSRPATVSSAAMLWWAATATWLLGAVLGLLLGGRTAAQLNLNGNSTGGVDPATLKSVAIVIAIVVLVVLAGLWALLVLGMRNGAAWARILLTIVGVLGLLSTLFAAVQSFIGSGDTQVGDIVQGVFDLATFVLALFGMIRMFSKEAGPYFSRI
ncbi:MAG TPA: hypothetical protein VJX66_04095 [Amycolatopsis sp.]|nr:hypothetical protein [Amycolatopsis sp.]